MADTSLFSRLQRLFSTNVIVRNVGGKKLRVVDTDEIQSTAKSNLIDRYTKLHKGIGLSGYSDTGLIKTIEWYLNNETWWKKIHNHIYKQERLGISS